MSRFFQKIKCFLGKHKYIVTQEFSAYSRRIACPCCRRSWAMNDDSRSVLDWDKDFENTYKVLGHEIKYKHWEKGTL